MSQDYVLIKSQKDEFGKIALHKSVFYSISELSIDEIENAVRIPKTRFNKPLKIEISQNEFTIKADLKVKYQANVNQTCELVQNKIYENIYNMTGLRAEDVEINVIGFDI